MKLLAFASRQPELQRQLWLEFSPARLVGMPAVLALVFAAFGQLRADTLASVAQTAFLLIVWAYGVRLASSALLDEVIEGTWDAQRLSSLTPWQLTAGKLFGGTAFAWYGGLFCVAAWWLASLAQGLPIPLPQTLTMVAGGLALQATALALALAAARRSPSAARRSGGGWWVLLVVVLPWTWTGALHTSDAVTSVWWGIGWPKATFMAATAVVFAGWAVLGAWRTMATSLQVPQRPVVWLAFLVWLAVFLAGGIDAGSAPWRIATALALVAGAAAYASLFLDPPRIDPWQRLAARWRESGWGVATQQRLPVMAASTALALAAGMLATMLALLGILGGGSIESAFGGPSRDTVAAAGAPLALALLALRDMALACALHWGREVRRAEGATLVLLAVINIVLPGFLFAVDLPMLAAWVQPALGLFGTGAIDHGGLIALPVAALQAVGAVLWARQRWRAARPATATA